MIPSRWLFEVNPLLIESRRQADLPKKVMNCFVFIKYTCKSKFSNYSKLACLPNKTSRLIISCKKKEYDHYSDQHAYDKFNATKLASKGWSHKIARGDYFTIHPYSTEVIQPYIGLSSVKINPKIQEYLRSVGITKATWLQAEAIAIINQRRHVLLAAETGCGKTLAYLIPIIQSISKTRSAEGNLPKVLILVPNRELAHQIADEAQELGDLFNLKTKLIVGGRTKQYMICPNFDTVDILVGTPGAIGKLVTVGLYKLNTVEFTVLDEADTLLDDSFADRLDILLRRLPQSQITLVSATLPKKIPVMLEPVAQTLQQIKSTKLHKPQMNIKQRFLRVLRSEKPVKILALVKPLDDSIIIFTNKNETCNWLAMFLRENGVYCANMNGDMNYAIRIEQWKRFLKGECNVLVATDIGSRGLNTIQVMHIINYDFPFHAADYIHRVGRAGRLGSLPNSEVTNFISSEQEIKLVQQIEMAVRTNSEIPNVDGNITRIIRKSMLKRIQEL